MDKKIKILVGILLFSFVLLMFINVHPSSAKDYAPEEMISPVHHFTELSDFWISGDIDSEGWVTPRLDNYTYVEYGDVQQHLNQTILYPTEDYFNTFDSNESTITGNVSYSGEKLVIGYNTTTGYSYENDSLVIYEGFNNSLASWENVSINSNLTISLNNSGHFDGNYTWIDDSGNPDLDIIIEGTSCSVDIYDSYDNHNKVVRLYDGSVTVGQYGAMREESNFIEMVSGYYEFSINQVSGLANFMIANSSWSNRIFAMMQNDYYEFNNASIYSLYWANGSLANTIMDIWVYNRIGFDAPLGTWNWSVSFDNGETYQFLYDSENTTTLEIYGGASNVMDYPQFQTDYSLASEFYIDSFDSSNDYNYYENRVTKLIDYDGYYISNVIDFNSSVEFFNISCNVNIPTNTSLDLEISDNSTGDFDNWMNFSEYIGNSSRFLKYKILLNDSIAIELPEFYNVTFNYTISTLTYTYLNASASWESEPIKLLDTTYPYEYEGYCYNLSSFTQYNDSINANMTFEYYFKHNQSGSWSEWLNITQMQELNYTFIKILINVTIEESESESIITSIVFIYDVLQIWSYKPIESFYPTGSISQNYYKGFNDVFQFEGNDSEYLWLNDTIHEYESTESFEYAWNSYLSGDYDTSSTSKLWFSFRVYIDGIMIWVRYVEQFNVNYMIIEAWYIGGSKISTNTIGSFDFENWENYRLITYFEDSSTLNYTLYQDSVKLGSFDCVASYPDKIATDRYFYYSYSYDYGIDIAMMGYDESIDNEYYPYRNTQLDVSGYDESIAYLTLFKESRFACNVIAFQQRFDKDFLGNLSGYNDEFSDTFLNIRLENGSNQENIIFRTRINEVGISTSLEMLITLFYAPSFIETDTIIWEESFSIPKIQSEDILLSFVIGFWKIDEYSSQELGASYQLKNSTHVFKNGNHLFDQDERNQNLDSINLQKIDGMVFQIEGTQYNVSGAIIQNGSIDFSSIRASEIYRYNDVKLDMYFSYEYMMNSPEFFCNKVFLNKFSSIGLLPKPDTYDEPIPLADNNIYLPLPIWLPAINTPPLTQHFIIPQIDLVGVGKAIETIDIPLNWYTFTWTYQASWYNLGSLYSDFIGGSWGWLDFFRIAINFILSFFSFLISFALYLFVISIIWVGFVFYTLFIVLLLSYGFFWVVFALLFLIGWVCFGALWLMVNLGFILAIVVSVFVWVFSGCQFNYFDILTIVYAGILNVILFSISLVGYTLTYIGYFGISILLYLSLILFLGIKRIVPQNEEVSRKAFDLETLWRILTAPLRWIVGALIKLKNFIANWG